MFLLPAHLLAPGKLMKQWSANCKASFFCKTRELSLSFCTCVAKSSQQRWKVPIVLYLAAREQKHKHKHLWGESTDSGHIPLDGYMSKSLVQQQHQHVRCQRFWRSLFCIWLPLCDMNGRAAHLCPPWVVLDVTLRWRGEAHEMQQQNSRCPENAAVLQCWDRMLLAALPLHHLIWSPLPEAVLHTKLLWWDYNILYKMMLWW